MWGRKGILVCVCTNDEKAARPVVFHARHRRRPTGRLVCVCEEWVSAFSLYTVYARRAESALLRVVTSAALSSVPLLMRRVTVAAVAAIIGGVAEREID